MIEARYEQALQNALQTALTHPDARFLLQHFVRLLGIYDVSGNPELAMHVMAKRQVYVELISDIRRNPYGLMLEKGIINDMIDLDREEPEVDEREAAALDASLPEYR